ncbi:MAG: ABC transporter substrate-binding protein [Desulfobacterales bacterium]|nr:ABC transporter substrate-binding protein [Desulfobacterales bacterium]
MSKSIKLIFIGIFIIFISTISANAYTFRPQWVPQCQFAGYYMAAQKGFYKNHGIDIEIKNGGPGIVGIQEVDAKVSDFTTAWLLAGIRMKENGSKIVLIGQFFQRPALLLIAKKSSGIDSPEKFSGHTLGVWPADFQLPPKALIRKYKVRNVKIIDQAFDMMPFIKGEIDIASAMRYNEYHQVLESGIKPEELAVFDYSKLGLNIPEDGIYVNEDFYKNNPSACKAFIDASVEGWKYCFEHKDEAVKLMTELANKTDFKTTEQKQRVMLDEVEKLIDLNDTVLKKEDFDTAVEILKSARIIQKEISLESLIGK